MAGPKQWPRGAQRGGRVRLGGRGAALALLLALLLVTAGSLVALPAVRCEVFGQGCHRPAPAPAATGPASTAPRPLTPVEAATRGAYVALGDSYSSGEGAYATAADLASDNRCHRTSLAYYHAVVEEFRFAGGSAFWACSGATTASVLKGRSGEPPQADRVDADTSLVTISVGGNDAGFSRVLGGCVVRLPWSRGCRQQGAEIAGRLAALRQSLTTVLDTITERAPRARVIVLGYPRIFAEVSGATGDNLTIGDQQWLNARARDLNEVIRQVAAERDHQIAATRGRGSVEFIDAYSAFSGHEIGSADPYVNGLRVNLSALAAEPGSFHPTAGGYRALGRLFVEQIRKGPGRPLNQFR
ncbi:GDSL-like Lipase/Acylhydrolase family protein [Thermomonospora echinospora]|uniref:GDSL-like Lipase/Acylhydrolase family protein n=1 Tax=Thermomonospora echinospora TaxID=1992 RepID=A0A1H5SV59_9ACTN|nr:SGNH/GDSL hydrolase family protein [Thermomonospora echinospora]SEF54334.1 GDSL-like Lipase/Acylhydrolase family protein [Thermomonospora echinospora]